MIIDTIKENLSINKVVARKKEILLIEGDMIVPDSKPDILSTICTSGVVCVYKKEVFDDKVRIDGSVNTFITYLADDEKDKVRGINTSLDFSETFNISGCKEGMDEVIETKLKSIECKVINGRKIGIKATLEVEIKIYSNDEVEIINEIKDSEDIKVLKDDLSVNSLVGKGETKIYAKDTIPINAEENIAEILKNDIDICDKDIKISYNKILTKAEAKVTTVYLTEDNRINCVVSKIPVVGFIDIPNVTEQNSCDINYEIKNMVIKLNPSEEHSIYMEIEVVVKAFVYEEKQIHLIQDLYSPCENLEFDTKRISTIANKKAKKDLKQIREKVMIEGIENQEILSVEVMPVIEKQKSLNNRIIYEGSLNLKFIMKDSNISIDTKSASIPFEYVIEDVKDASSEIEIEVANSDYIIQEGGVINCTIDLLVNQKIYNNINLNIMNEIQSNGAREIEDYSIIIYVVQKGDTLWNIAKKFGSTVECIAKVNEIEDENKICVGQKIFVPRYARSGVNRRESSMVNYE